MVSELVIPKDISQIYYDRLQHLSKPQKIKAIGNIILECVEGDEPMDPAKLLACFWETPYFFPAIKSLGLKFEDLKFTEGWSIETTEGPSIKVIIPIESVRYYLGEL